MTKQVQRRRGTATQHTSFTGAEGELSVNTTNKSVHVHDNVTAGGFEAARADMDNVTSSSILTAAGITATTTELNYVDGVTSNIQTQLDGKAGTASPTFTGTLTTANLTATGTTTLAGASTSADITFGDNDKAIFGAGSDLEVFHDGAASYVQDTGTGNLQLRGDNSVALRSYSTTDNYLVGNFNGSVDIYYDNSIKLATSSSGVDITGVLTSDGLTVNTSADGNISTFKGDLNYFYIKGSGADTILSTVGSGGNASNLFFQTDPFVSEVNRMQINKDGDISFYDDQGSSQSFFWSAADESLGLGSTSPDSGRKLHIEGGDTTVGITLKDTAGTQYGIKNDANSFIIRNDSLGLDRLTIDSSGNVGIGADLPDRPVHLSSAGTRNYFKAETTGAANSSESGFEIKTPSSNWLINSLGATDALIFYDLGNTSEAMRIDSSGNLLVGKTTTSTADQGIQINPAGRIDSTSDGAEALRLNRKTSNGEIVQFRKDNAPVGSIGTNSGNIYLTDGARSLIVDGSVVKAGYSTGSNADNAQDLGESGTRWKDLYLSGGVYLGGTGSANLLDDYEYGFFEPEFGGDVSDPTVTYDGTVGNEGWYVKVGRLVFIQINMRTDSVSGGSGAVVIRNLPFVTPNLSGQGGMSSFTIGYADNWAGERPIAGTIAEGVTYINLSHRSAVDGNNITTNITDLGTGANANLIRLSGTYYTTA